jgi:hypothetical protein
MHKAPILPSGAAGAKFCIRVVRSTLALGVLCFALAAGSSSNLAAAGIAAAQPDKAQKGHHEAHVYLMRGLMNIFSLGMDQLASTVAAHGIEASVYNHAEADAVVSHIVARYRAGDHGSIVLIGHSLGADAVMLMAQSLNRMGIPVALVVPFDGTASYEAPKNVACVLNVTQRAYSYIHAGVGFHGKLSNLDVRGDPGIDHFTIDKAPRLQAYALKSILEAANEETCRPDAGTSTSAKLKDGRTSRVAAHAPKSS